MRTTHGELRRCIRHGQHYLRSYLHAPRFGSGLRTLLANTGNNCQRSTIATWEKEQAQDAGDGSIAVRHVSDYSVTRRISGIPKVRRRQADDVGTQASLSNIEPQKRQSGQPAYDATLHQPPAVSTDQSSTCDSDAQRPTPVHHLHGAHDRISTANEAADGNVVSRAGSHKQLKYQLKTFLLLPSLLKEILQRKRTSVLFPRHPDTDQAVLKIAARLGLACGSHGMVHVLSATTHTLASAPDTLILPDEQAVLWGPNPFQYLIQRLKKSLTQEQGLDRMVIDGAWKLLQAACQGRVDAFPQFECTQEDGTPIHAKHEVGHSKRLTLRSGTYGVVVSEVAYDMIHVEAVLAELLLEYCEQISMGVSRVPAGLHLLGAGTSMQPSVFLSRAASALDLPPIKHVDDEAIPIVLEDGKGCFDLCSSTVLLGADRIQCHWYSGKTARLLSILSACAAIKPQLEAAYASGTLLAADYDEFAVCWEQPGTPRQSAKSTSLAGFSDIYDVPLNSKILLRMIDALRDLRDLDFKAAQAWLPVNDLLDQPSRPVVPAMTIRYCGPRAKLKTSPGEAGALRSDKQTLPVLQQPYPETICTTISSHDVTIIKASTGSGKTTQVPQLLLDRWPMSLQSMTNLVCTQPRRVSTVSVARRVAAERNEKLGEHVGYQVRFDNKNPTRANSVNYMTSGYLLRLLETDPVHVLTRYSHIILDEVHERDMDTDLILTALKNMLKNPVSGIRKMPKIILMSATIDISIFTEYFSNLGKELRVGTVEVPGKAYHVAEEYLDETLLRLAATDQKAVQQLQNNAAFMAYHEQQLGVVDPALVQKENTAGTSLSGEDEDEMASKQTEDSGVPSGVQLELVALTVADILSRTTRGDVLVFLPGLAEIEHLEELLARDYTHIVDFADTDTHRLFKLHSSLYETNYDVFKPIPPSCRRIVLATNIAETSITLPSVEYVVDTGLSRSTTFDQANQAGNFGLRWISKAEAAQRRGRAGRTRPGTYIATFSRAHYAAMSPVPMPEMLRSSLDQVILRTQASEVFRVPAWSDSEEKVGEVLRLAPSAPLPENVTAAVKQLKNIHSLADDGKITPMGLVQSNFPVRPAASRAILFALVFQALGPIIFMATMRDDNPIMYSPTQPGAVQAMRRKLSGTSDDDRLTDWRAFMLYDNAQRQRDREATKMLRHSHSISHGSYCEMVNTSKQVFEPVQSLIGSKTEVNDRDTPSTLLFPTIPQQYQANSTNENIIKALNLSISGSQLALWQGKHWQGHLHRRILPSTRSVTHTDGRKAKLARYRRENGDLLAYASLRIVPSDKYPWASRTSIVSPLTALLFAESVHIAGPDVLVINDWIRYKITTDPAGPFDSARAAKIVLEYRKALERFLAHAMANITLYPHRLKAVKEGRAKVEDFNAIFRDLDNPVRKVIVDSVVEVLDADGEDRRQRAEKRKPEQLIEDEAEVRNLGETQVGTEEGEVSSTTAALLETRVEAQASSG